jgi:hypothetical protein
MNKWIVVGALIVSTAIICAGGGWAVTHQASPSVARPVTVPFVSPILAPAPVDKLPVAGRPSFWAGVNYPWKTGQDFGTGGWGHSGASDSTTYREIDADFANMAAQGVRIVKWRVFSDARYGIQFDPAGNVVGVDEYFMKDIDAALEIAQRHDMYLLFTLFSSGLWTADCQSNGVHLGGQAQTLMDGARRQALIERAVIPLLDRVATTDRVIAYEIIAEPEWGIDELNQQPDARVKLPLGAIRDFVGQVTDAIHQHGHSLATVESNRFSNMSNWQRLGLDYYSFSWYDWLEAYEPLATPAAAANLDRPIVLGEYPAGGSAYYTLPAVLDLASSLGYAGAFGWSYWSGDNISHWREVAPSYATWVAAHWADVGLGSAAQPTAASAGREQAYPYSFRDFALQSDGPDVVASMRIDVPSGEAYVPHAYLYQFGVTQPVEDVRLSAASGQPGKLAARFTSPKEGVAYTVSLGIFDPSGTMRKWFNNVAAFAVSGGTLTTPQLDTLTSELGCGS